MPRVAVEDNSRMSLRIRPEEKALLLRAVALNHTDLTDFVIRHAVRQFMKCCLSENYCASTTECLHDSRILVRIRRNLRPGADARDVTSDINVVFD